MCVIIHKPAGKNISYQRLKKCWDSNPHGAGLMWVDDSVLKIKKGFLRFKDFYKFYELVKNKNLVIHFRYASEGIVNSENTHPFNTFDGKLGMCHNGTIKSDFISAILKKFTKKKKTAKNDDIDLSKYTKKSLKTLTDEELMKILEKVEEQEDNYYCFLADNDSEISDTMAFNDYILKKLPNDFLKNPVLVELIKQYCDGSCLVFLDNNNKVTKIGQYSDPVVLDGVWYSNDTWKTVTKHYYRPYYSPKGYSGPTPQNTYPFIEEFKEPIYHHNL